MVHIILFSVIIIAINARKDKKESLFFCFCILYLFSALRYDYGNDYNAYYAIHENIKNGVTAIQADEPIFFLLNFIIPDYYFFIAITSIPLLLVVYKLIKNHVDYRYIGVAVFIFVINPYLFLMSLSAIKQTLAMDLFIKATYFSKRKKIIPYILLILIATLIHASAIILLPFYFVANEKKVGIIQLVVFLMGVLILLLGWDLFDEFFSNLIIALFDDPNYIRYFEQDRQNTIRATLLTSVTGIYLLLNIRKLEGASLMCAKLYLIGIALGVLAYRVSMLTRFQMYFDIFSVVAIPSILQTNKEPKIEEPEWLVILNKFVFPLLIFVIYLARYYSFFTNSLWEAFFTYKTILRIL